MRVMAPTQLLGDNTIVNRDQRWDQRCVPPNKFKYLEVDEERFPNQRAQFSNSELDGEYLFDENSNKHSSLHWIQG